MHRFVFGAGLLLLPGITLAVSPLSLECSAEQHLPGRALICEYTMLESRNADLADLHDRVVQAGKTTRIEPKRWVAVRDACRDVECLDQLYEQGMREARLALVEVESRTPAPVLTNARGELLRVVQTKARPIARSEPPPPVAEQRSVLDTLASLLMVLFLVAAFACTLVARRRAA